MSLLPSEDRLILDPPERGGEVPSGLVPGELDGDESGRGVIAGSTLIGLDGGTSRGLRNLELDEEGIGCEGAVVNTTEPAPGEGGGEPSVEDRPPTTDGEKCTFFNGTSAEVEVIWDSFSVLRITPLPLDPTVFTAFGLTGEPSESFTPFHLFTAPVNPMFIDEGNPTTSEPGVATVLQFPGLDISGGGTLILGRTCFNFRGGVWSISVSAGGAKEIFTLGTPPTELSLGVCTLDESAADGTD